jgi:IS6 family transposase
VYRRNKKAAKRFFKKILRNSYINQPKVIGVDKNPAYPPAFAAMQQEKRLFSLAKLRQVQYLNNCLEADHRFVKRRIRYKQWFQTFRTAANTIAGYEAMNITRKGQIRYVAKNDVLAQKQFIENLFLAA